MAAAVAAAVAVGCIGNDSAKTTRTSSEAASPRQVPERLAPLDIAKVDAILKEHRTINAFQNHVIGDEKTLDFAYRAKRAADRAARVAKPGKKVDWEITTGAPVIAGPSFGGSWEAESPSNFMVFGVDSYLPSTGTYNAAGGITGGVTNPSGLSGAALFVISNLYSPTPTVVSSALSSASVSFGPTYLFVDETASKAYGLSREGNVYCFNVPSLTPCAGNWPYVGGSRSTWSAAWPLFAAGNRVTSFYFGDDAGYFHCVQAAGSAAPGSPCWPAGKVMLAPGNAAPLGPPEGTQLPTGVEAIFVGDEKGRFFRILDTGSAPVPGTDSVAQQDLCGGAPNTCATNPWAVRSLPLTDYIDNVVYVAAAGMIFEYPLSPTAPWQPVVGPKTLFTNPNGPIQGGMMADGVSNIYLTARSTLFQVSFPFDGNPSSNVLATALRNRVTSVPSNYPDFPGASAGTDSFPLGYPLPYYGSVYVPTGQNVSSGSVADVEQYACVGTTSAPVLDSVSTGSYGAMISTGVELDNLSGNINFGFGTGGPNPTGGFVQYPAGDPNPAGWACPDGKVSCPSACGGTMCVDTQSDATNCGACGSVCAGACTAGRCLTTLASGQAEPFAIALDANYVYWTNNYNGTVMRVPVGGGTPAAVATGQGHPEGIAVDGANVYWTSATSLLDAPLTGGAPTTLAASQNGPWAVASNGASLFWANEGTYAGSFKDGAIAALSLGAAGSVTMLASAQYAPAAIALDQNNVYWVDAGSGAIMQIAIGGSTSGPTMLASGAAVGTPHAIALDATSVYWTNYKSAGAVLKVPIGGGTVTTIAAGQAYPYGIATDGVSVFWTNSGSGTVMAAPVGGGAVKTLATGQGTPEGIVVDGGSVYWVTHGNTTANGTVVKTRKD